MSANPEDCCYFPVDPFLLSGNRHLFSFAMFFVAESDIFVPKLGFVCLQSGSSDPGSRTFTLTCTPQSHRTLYGRDGFADTSAQCHGDLHIRPHM